MSLVDYASSSEEEDEDEDEKQVITQKQDVVTPSPPAAAAAAPEKATIVSPSHRHSTSSLQRPSDTASNLSLPSIEKLPDAALLLNSPVFSARQTTHSGDHTSRVAAAMAQSATRKRESNGSVSSCPRNKHPRGNSHQSTNLPGTVGSFLVPPQLSGRSNVVTEDIGKLFVKKGANSSSQ